MNIVFWLQDKHPHLGDELLLLDRAFSGILFHSPEHTISYNIAVRARDGDALAQMLCKALNDLSPNHCANVIQDENSQRWRELVQTENTIQRGTLSKQGE